MSSASYNQSPSQAIRDPSPASQIPRFAAFRSVGHLPEQIASRLRADCEGLPFHLPTDRLHVGTPPARDVLACIRALGVACHLPTDRLHVGIPPARDVRRPRGTRLHLARVLLERNTHLMRGAIRGARRDAAPHSSGAHAFEWRACIRVARMHTVGSGWAKSAVLYVRWYALPYVAVSSSSRL